MDFMLGHCDDPALVERARSIAEVHSTSGATAGVLRAGPERPRAAHAGAVHLAYFGVFYETRDLGDLVQALLRLRQHERERVRCTSTPPSPTR